MLHRRLVVIGIAIITASIACSALAQSGWAQSCDDRYPWTCRGYAPPQSIEPRAPYPAPYPTPYPAPYAAPYPPQYPPPYQQRQYAPYPQPAAPTRPSDVARPIDPALRNQYAALYARIDGEPFPVPAVNLSAIDPEYLRKSVVFPTNEPAGTIVIDAQNRFLYFVQGGGRAMRYGVGVGRQGFGWSGVATIHDKQEWPDWYPPKEMLARQPELRRQMSELQSGVGMPGGPRNPLGSRAMYLWQNDKDTLYRIHGTVEPWTIGQSVSSGCIRMINQDVIDLYQRVPVGAKVVVLSARS